jgi:hypothetical protein
VVRLRYVLRLTDDSRRRRSDRSTPHHQTLHPFVRFDPSISLRTGPSTWLPSATLGTSRTGLSALRPGFPRLHSGQAGWALRSLGYTQGRPFDLAQGRLWAGPSITLRTGLVSRPRLIEQLNVRLHRKLTLISASAGFGIPAPHLVGKCRRYPRRCAVWPTADVGETPPIGDRNWGERIAHGSDRMRPLARERRCADVQVRTLQQAVDIS